MSSLIGRAVSNRSNSPAANPTALQRIPRQIVEAGNESSISEVSLTIRKDPAKVAVQGIFAGAGSEIKDNQLQTNIYTAEQTFYFDLVLYEVITNEMGDEALVLISPQAPLHPHKTYVVRVSDNLNRYSETENNPAAWKMKQEPVITRGLLSLTLEEYFWDTEAAIESPEGLGQFDPTQQGEWFYDFRITTRESFSKKSMFLELRHYGLGTPRLATRLEVLLEQTVDSVPRAVEILPCYLPVRAEPPEKTAILHILPEDQNQLRFVGWVRDLKDRPSSLNPIVFPLIASEDYGEEIEYLKAIWEKLNDFAGSNPGNIAQWFEAVLDLYKEDCCIVIVDQTEAQLPWEMFKLSGGRYLGTQAAIVRWAEEQYRGQAIRLQLDSAEYSGRVAAYLHSREPSISALNKLVSYYCSTLSELQYELLASKGNPKAGLVYLSHTNIVAYGDEESVIAQLRNSSGQTVKLRFDDVEGLVEQRPIFFVNSPYSGRILWSGQKSCGLVKAVLTQVASGYIGALGPVHPAFAAWVANQFLAASSSQGVRPAYFLRKLRAFAVKEFQEAMTDPTLREKARRKLLYSFMYVYYGNPRALLKVVPTQSTSS
jgi:hypothetical protein